VSKRNIEKAKQLSAIMMKGKEKERKKERKRSR
jgi:hypothetical protein